LNDITATTSKVGLFVIFQTDAYRKKYTLAQSVGRKATPITMPKSVSEILSISNEAQIRSCHLVNFARDHTAACCIGSDILRFVDIVPNTMTLGRDDRVAQCEGLLGQRKSEIERGARGWRINHPGDVAVIPIKRTTGINQSEVVFSQDTVRSASMR
jgi:hypothetical protein